MFSISFVLRLVGVGVDSSTVASPEMISFMVLFDGISLSFIVFVV
jgi:hypothetical protein